MSVGFDLLAAIGEDAVGGRHLQQRRFAGAERHRPAGCGKLVIDAEPLGQLGNLAHAEIMGEADRHHIARLLDAAAQRRGAEVLVLIVLGLPDLRRSTS